MDPQLQRLFAAQRFAEAAALLERALASQPTDDALRLQLAEAVFRAGDAARAREVLEQLIALAPAHVTARFQLGWLAQVAGDAPAAEKHYRALLALQPDHVDTLFNLSQQLRAAGRHAEALAGLERARLVAPQRADVATMLAWSLIDHGRHREAADAGSAALGLNPRDASAWHVVGLAWRYLGAWQAAVKALRQAVALATNDAAIAQDLAVALMERGDYAASLAEFQRAITLVPGQGAYRWREALATCVFPRSADEARDAQARFAAGVERLDAALAAGDAALWAPALDVLASISPYYLHYQPLDSMPVTCRFGDLVARVVQRDCAALCTPLPWRALAHGGRARVAFVCGAFREHTVARYFAAWLAGLDRAHFEVSAWHLSAQTDAITAQIAASVDAFHQVDALDARAIGARLRDAQPDAIVYLDIGLEGRAHLLGAMRLAPVQCAAYGHPVTTGLARIDAFLSGAAMEPADADAHYRERLVRLPGLGAVPMRPPAAGDGSWLPRVADRPLLVCAQNVVKLTPAFDHLVARIAQATRARIVFFENAPHLRALFEARLGAAFAAHGLSLADHVVIEKKRDYAAYLGGLAAADLVLDATHFSGGRSSLDALHVGAPVLTVEGRWMRGRQTAAMLRLLGADALIATDDEDFVTKAIALCADPAQRAALRGAILDHVDRLFTAPAVLPALAAWLTQAVEDAARTAR